MPLFAAIQTWIYSRLRELKGIWSRICWLRYHIGKIFLTALSGTLTVIVLSNVGGGLLEYFSDISNYGVLLEAVSIITIVFSGIIFFAKQRVSLSFNRLPNVTTIETLLNEKICEFRGQAILYDPEVNFRINDAHNTVLFDKQFFSIHPLIRELLPLFLFKMPEVSLDTVDDGKVRLRTDFTTDMLERNAVVSIQKTSYYCDRLSNTLANYQVCIDGREILNLRNEAFDSGMRLFRLKDSHLSNQLGASSLLLTSDSAVIYLRQGNRAAENPRHLAPSGSGSFDLPPDLRKKDYVFQDFARKEALRELCEECGISKKHIINIQLCGFGRYLYRNGKPEVFCIATTTLHSHQIKVPVKEWDFQEKEVQAHYYHGKPNVAHAVNGLEEIKERIEKAESGFTNVSAPLYWNIVFALDYLKQIGPEAQAALFGKF